MIRENKEPRDKNGIPHGLWEWYYDNGQLWFKGYYVHGKRYGHWESHYYKGQLRFRGYYINGYKHGYHEEYCLDGQLMYKGCFIRDEFLKGVYITTKNKMLL